MRDIWISRWFKALIAMRFRMFVFPGLNGRACYRYEQMKHYSIGSFVQRISNAISFLCKRSLCISNASTKAWSISYSWHTALSLHKHPIVPDSLGSYIVFRDCIFDGRPQVYLEGKDPFLTDTEECERPWLHVHFRSPPPETPKRLSVSRWQLSFVPSSFQSQSLVRSSLVPTPNSPSSHAVRCRLVVRTGASRAVRLLF